MGELLKIVFCVLLGCVIKEAVSQCEVINDYYVASYGSDTPDCREPNRPDTPCATLQYATNESCSTVRILDDLTIDSETEITDLHDVTVTGYSSTRMDGRVTLQCYRELGIVFVRGVNIAWQNIHLRNCSKLQMKIYTLWLNSCQNVLIQNCSFQSYYGGYSIRIESFTYPHWSDLGSTTIKYCDFIGSPTVSIENSYSSGIGVDILSAQLFLNILSCNFINHTVTVNSECSNEALNYTSRGGALNIEYYDWRLGFNMTVTIQNSVFDSNTANEGGAIGVKCWTSCFLSIVSTLFMGNQAFCQGGAIGLFHHPGTSTDIFCTLTCKNCTFNNNSANWGGAVAVIESCCRSSTRVEISDSYWISNTASTLGLALAVMSSKSPNSLHTEKFVIELKLSGQNYFCENYRSDDGTGAIAAENSFVVFDTGGEAIFLTNNGTAIALKSCETVFEGKTSFSSNSGTLGGAILVDGDSVLSFGPTCNVSFYGNSASGLGGAIYSAVSEYCTFDVSQMTDGSLVSFGPNSAGLSDQSIYLKSISKCDDIKDLLDKFYFENPSEKGVSLPVESVTFEIIDTMNGEVLSSQSIIALKLGQAFYVQPTVKDVLGQNTTTGVGYISLESSYYQLVGPSKINLDSYTSSVEFSIRGQEVLQDTPVTLSIAYEKSGVLDISSVSIDIVVAPCNAFQKYSDVNQTCTCGVENPDDYKKCSKYNRVCLRKHYWLSDDKNSCYPCPALNCIYSVSTTGCPYIESNSDICEGSDFCVIENLDNVCRDGRNGFLCSECKEGHAFTFEAFHCVSNTTCDDKNTLYLSLSLVAYWVLLILAFVLVLSLKISVGSGFMFGIIYYFSVALIYTRSSAVFGKSWVQTLMYINAAIALLDPGLLGYWWKVCFTEKWTTPLPHELFRLATPLFLMVLVVVFILIARYCRLPRRFAISGSSPVHAICLLILLSYTSVSYTSWKILVPFTTADNTYRVQVAPTMEYFGSDSDKFTPFFVVALLVQVFICLPVCFFFLFAPILSKRINLVKLRLKPILDEFHACYKPEYRWFAGFYFLARQVVYLVCMPFTESYPQSNSLLTTVNILVLMTHTIAQPYSKKWLNMIDTILLADIVVLSLWSPETVSTGKGIIKGIHNDVIPYTLILVPTVYLFVALFVIFFKKLFFNRCNQRFQGMRIKFRLPAMLKKPEGGNDRLQLKSNTTTVIDPISNKEYREPLLEDLDTKVSSDSSSSGNYGSMVM